MTDIDELRAQLGDGPACIVRATEPPSMAVEVGTCRVALEDGRTVVNMWEGPVLRAVPNDLPRIDLICIRANGAEVLAKAMTGAPGPLPEPPWLWSGDEWIPVARVRIRPGNRHIYPSDIEEIRT